MYKFSQTLDIRLRTILEHFFFWGGGGGGGFERDRDFWGFGPWGLFSCFLGGEVSFFLKEINSLIK
jgi:hypothetical protein